MPKGDVARFVSQPGVLCKFLCFLWFFNLCESGSIGG